MPLQTFTNLTQVSSVFPVRKVQAAGISGSIAVAISTMIVWLVANFTEVTVTPEIEATLAAVITGVATLASSVIAAYQTAPAKGETIETVYDQRESLE